MTKELRHSIEYRSNMNLITARNSVAADRESDDDDDYRRQYLDDAQDDTKTEKERDEDDTDHDRNQAVVDTDLDVDDDVEEGQIYTARIQVVIHYT